jgi:short-subunit dehydrogenase
MKHILIIGGTSGLGASFTRLLNSSDQKLTITGRKNTQFPDTAFFDMDLSDTPQNVAVKINGLLDKIGKVDMVIYSAGMWSPKTFKDSTIDEVIAMQNTIVTSCQVIIHQILQTQSTLESFVCITSESQFKPEKGEEVYGTAKAALGHFAQTVSLSGDVNQTLIIAPPQMYKDGEDRTKSANKLEPDWVAEKTLELMEYMSPDQPFAQYVLAKDNTITSIPLKTSI